MIMIENSLSIPPVGPASLIHTLILSLSFIVIDLSVNMTVATAYKQDATSL